MKCNEMLGQIISEKQRANPRLSLRAIAYKMGIPSGRLSEILSGKRRLTEYYLDRSCAALKISSTEETLLRKAYQQEMLRSEKSKNVYGHILTEDQIEKLINWKPYALMSFLQTTTYAAIAKQHPSKELQAPLLSKMTNIPVQELQSLIQIMIDINLIRWEDCQWSPYHEEASTGYDVPNKALLAAHSQDLDLAKSKLYAVDISKRDFSSMTIAMDPKDIVKAKKMIRSFRRSFTRNLEKNRKKEVFRISIQFFPVIESENK